MLRNSALTLLALGMVVSVGTQTSDAQTRIQKQFENWRVDCVEPDANENRCTMIQTFQGQNQRTNRRTFAFSWAMTFDRDDVEKAVLRTPLGVDIENQINVDFPGLDPIVIGFDVCNRRGCFADITMDEAWRNALQRNEKVTVTYKIRNGNNIPIEMTLAGFADAYAFYRDEMNK